MFREALRALLERDGGFAVVAEAGTGQEAIEISAALKPDLLLTELLLPDLHGFEVLKRLVERPGCRPVVLTSQCHASYALEALRHGAAGCVLKEEGGDELMVALRHAAEGEPYLSRSLRSRTLIASLGQRPAAPEGQHARLSVRERVVLEMVAEGLTNSEVAQRLKISRRTVESHRANLMQKLGIRTQADLIRFAIRHNIVQV